MVACMVDVTMENERARSSLLSGSGTARRRGVAGVHRTVLPFMNS